MTDTPPSDEPTPTSSQHEYREPSYFDKQVGYIEPVHTLTQSEAAGREDAVFDPKIGAHRQLYSSEVVSPSTVRTFKLEDGSLIDLPMHMACDHGLAEWNPDWGVRRNENGFTADEQAEIDKIVEEANEGYSEENLREGFSPDAPLEAVNLAQQWAYEGVQGEPGDLVDHLEVASDTEITLSQDAQRFLSERLGIGDQHAAVERITSAIWTQAHEAIGTDGLQQLEAARKYNPEAAKDVNAYLKKAFNGQATKSDLLGLLKKWSR